MLAVQGAYSSLMNITLTIGEAQARELNVQLRARQSAGEPGVDLLLASPLRRALATAEIGFDGVACASRRVEPLAAER